MTYFNSDFKEPIPLPDGSVASNSKELDAYFERTGTTKSSDYSKTYFKNKQFQNNLEFSQELFEAFLINYKRMIFK